MDAGRVAGAVTREGAGAVMPAVAYCAERVSWTGATLETVGTGTGGTGTFTAAGALTGSGPIGLSASADGANASAATAASTTFRRSRGDPIPMRFLLSVSFSVGMLPAIQRSKLHLARDPSFE